MAGADPCGRSQRLLRLGPLPAAHNSVAGSLVAAPPTGCPASWGEPQSHCSKLHHDDEKRAIGNTCLRDGLNCLCKGKGNELAMESAEEEPVPTTIVEAPAADEPVPEKEAPPSDLGLLLLAGDTHEDVAEGASFPKFQ